MTKSWHPFRGLKSVYSMATKRRTTTGVRVTNQQVATKH